MPVRDDAIPRVGFPNALTLENLSYTAKVNEEVKIRQPACQA